MIEMKHLYISFDDKVIFNNASFNADKGHITGIVGPSGCGKTSFLKALLYKYQSQLLTIDGIDINNENKDSYRSHYISYIDQFGSFFENMKIIEHFMFIDQIRNQKFDEEKMHRTFHFVGLDSIESNLYPPVLSIGQRKRFLIALALYKDASLIIMDEPTASLDEESKKSIFFILQELKKQNKYIILTTHDKKLIAQCDVIYKIENQLLITDYHQKLADKKNKIEPYHANVNRRYFLYKNKRQWFQFIMTSLLGLIMVLSISINICDSFLQENQLASGIERANKAEVYVGKMNDAIITYGNPSNWFTNTSQEDNLNMTNEELQLISQLEHVKSIHRFDTIDTINQYDNILSTTIEVNQEKNVKFDYQKENTPLIVPYFDFQNIQSQNKEIRGNAISKSLAKALGIDENMKNLTISLTAFIPTQQYTYRDDVRIGNGTGKDEKEMNCELSKILFKKVKMNFQIDCIVDTDDYYNEFLESQRIILVPENDFNKIMDHYSGQVSDRIDKVKDYQSVIEPYRTKNYILEIDRVKNIKEVEREILNISQSLVIYDQYNSVIDTTEIYRAQRKDRLIFIVLVIFVAIILFSMILINTLDDRKEEIQLLSFYGYNQKHIHLILTQNMKVLALLCVVLSLPAFYYSIKLGYFVVNVMSTPQTITMYFFINFLVIAIVYLIYSIYCHYIVKKVIS